MRAITRSRIFVATGLLGISALLGTTAAAAMPAVAASQPGMQGEGVLTGMTSDAQPGMQGESLPGMQNE
jgi:hypothetical protein